MPRTPARFRQCDIARAIKAVEQCGVEQCGVDMRVVLQPDGRIVIEKSAGADAIPTEPIEASREFRL